ncbi:MAG TPA: lamin tail domain-containing protein, partial [Candidatus Acidoferrum sp.]|nr:lamin tail domain-containing protein [Candidatus Acidoferrum sp.]
MIMHLCISRTHFRISRWLGVGLVLAAASWSQIAIGQTVFTNTVITSNSTWRVFRGVSEASAPVDAWRTIAYNDNVWEVLAAPFHYGTNSVGGDDALTGGTILGNMAGNYSSIYLRQQFVLTNATAVIGISMRFWTDDGIIVWLNGVELRRAFAPAGVVAYNGNATSSHEPNVTVLVPTIANAVTNLVEGTNVITVHAFNAAASAANDDFRVDPEVWFTVAIPPVIASVTPPPGSAVAAFNELAITFSQSVSNVNAEDLLINGEPASSVSGAGSNYVFQFIRPSGGTGLVTWDPAHGIKNSVGSLFDSVGVVWDYTVPLGVVALSPSAGATLASVTEVQATFSDPVFGVDAGDLLINGVPAESVFGSGTGPYIFNFPSPPNGTVQFAWSGGNGITDLNGNPFTGGNWTVTLDPTTFTGDIVINEFLAGNNLTNSPLDLDEDNEIQDWIELYNRGTNAVRLLGWSLTNDRDLPGLWTFPDVTLAPGKYLLVYTSEKNRLLVGGLNGIGKTNQLHTNFKLSLFGEYLALMSADSPRRIVQEFTPEYPEQRNDYSYGSVGTNGWRYFATPTPLATNGVSTIAQLVSKPHVNAARGLYDAPFTVAASCEFPGASMRYTTDGTAPNETVGTLYTGPIVISNTTIFRIMAYQSNLLPSRIATYSYIFLDGVLAQSANPPGLPTQWIAGGTGGVVAPADYEMDPEIMTNAAYAALMKPALKALPELSLALKPSDFFDSASGIYANPNPGVNDRYKWERAGSAEFLVNSDDEEGFQIDCGLRMQGNASRDPLATSKHPIRLTFKGAFGSGRLKYQLFPDSPVDSFNTIVLRADYNNGWTHREAAQRLRGTRIRDAWGKDTFRAMGQPAAHSRYVHLFLSGLYWGIYEFSERADA